MNYTQDWIFADKYVVKFQADLFNVTDNQTGYNLESYASNDTFGEPRRLYNPRRLQLSARIEF